MIDKGQNQSGINGCLESSDRDLFNRIAARYSLKDIVKSTSACRRYQLLFAIKPVKEKKNNDNIIVDIACGAGAPAKYLRGFYGRYIGVDYSEEMIKEAMSFNEDMSNVQFICSDIKGLNMHEPKADVILAIGALHYMHDLNRVFDSLKKIAKPGTFFIALAPQRANFMVQFLRWLRGKTDRLYSKDQRYFSKKELFRLLENNRLTDVEIKYQGFFSPPFAQVMLRSQIVFLPLAYFAVALDKLLDFILPEFLKFFSWNIAIKGRFS